MIQLSCKIEVKFPQLLPTGITRGNHNVMSLLEKLYRHWKFIILTQFSGHFNYI